MLFMMVFGVSPTHRSLLEATKLHKMKMDAIQRDKGKSSRQLMRKEVDNDHCVVAIPLLQNKTSREL